MFSAFTLTCQFNQHMFSSKDKYNYSKVYCLNIKPKIQCLIVETKVVLCLYVVMYCSCMLPPMDFLKIQHTTKTSVEKQNQPNKVHYGFSARQMLCLHLKYRASILGSSTPKADCSDVHL